MTTDLSKRCAKNGEILRTVMLQLFTYLTLAFQWLIKSKISNCHISNVSTVSWFTIYCRPIVFFLSNILYTFCNAWSQIAQHRSSLCVFEWALKQTRFKSSYTSTFTQQIRWQLTSGCMAAEQRCSCQQNTSIGN